MKILAIETSCDETALALVEAEGTLKDPKFKVKENLVASQIKIHRPFGGVVPNLAKREHLKHLPILFRQMFGKEPMANSLLKQIDLIAVTSGPGLEPALWAGITFAKELYKKLLALRHKPLALVGANHLEGHLYSFLLSKKERDIFPAVGLIVSGGHTTLLLLKNLATRKKLGETRDDAVGEAYDKVARILNLPYPGGPEVEKLALRQAQGKHPNGTINFPSPMINEKSYDFSFSGLKTSVFYYLRDHKDANPADVAASFQKAAAAVLIKKTLRAVREYGAKSVLLSGGVASNKYLRDALEKETEKVGVKFLVADFKFNTDNAAMIGAAAYINFLTKKKFPLTARGDLNIK